MRLKPNSVLCLARPYPVPLPQTEDFKKVLDRQETEGIIRRLSPVEVEKCELAFPAFGVPKKDKKSIRTVGNFRKLNSCVDRTSCHIEPTNDMLMSLGACAWGSAFDLNMGCYAMRLCQKTRKFVRLITIWGTCECLVLWMGTSPASDTFRGRL